MANIPRAITADLHGHLIGQTVADTIRTAVIYAARNLACLEMSGQHLGALEQITLNLEREKNALMREQDQQHKEAKQVIVAAAVAKAKAAAEKRLLITWSPRWLP